MNIVDKIELRLKENKSSIKTYSNYFFTNAQGERIGKEAMEYYGAKAPMNYIVVYLPNLERFTLVFLMSEFLNREECGGYIGWIAQKGFFSI